jgi:acyl carrier protein
MLKEEQILKIILQSLTSLNEELDDKKKFQVNKNTKLFGPGAPLDSLALVSVIVDVEGEVSKEVGHTISLTDDYAMSQTVSPFNNVQTLLNFIMMLVNKDKQ